MVSVWNLTCWDAGKLSSVQLSQKPPTPFQATPTAKDAGATPPSDACMVQGAFLCFLLLRGERERERERDRQTEALQERSVSQGIC